MSEIRQAGRATMAGSSVAICGLARDCSTNLKRLIPQLEKLGISFRAYRVIVAENDSTDETGQVLHKWSEREPSVRAIRFCYLDQREPKALGTHPDGNAWFGFERMERMAFARNQYLEALQEYAAPDFVIVMDMDIRSFSLAGVEHSFGLLGEWDIATANGTRYSARNAHRLSVYWDSYAYEPHLGFEGGVQTREQIRQDQRKVADKLATGRLLPARSAFGGLAIYRSGVLWGHRYSVIPNGCADVPVLCDHPSLHRSIRHRLPDVRLVINPSMRVNYGSTLQLAAQALGKVFK